MRYLSLFSGIEAASTAWEPLGWTPVAFAEIDAFPSELLKQRYPHVPNLGDVSAITEAQIAALGLIDLVIFGSPCQDLSVAGKREGMAGERSGLFHEAVRLLRIARDRCGCRWGLWENVPGAFSSNTGRDFAAVVESLSGARVDVPEDGWGSEGVALGWEGFLEWAVLDAQWFGLAQRRERVFALVDFGDWASRPPVLLESDRLRGNLALRRETRKDVAGSLAARTQGGGGLGTDFELDGGLAVASALTRAGGHHGYSSPRGDGSDNLIVGQAFGGNNCSGPIDVATALNACHTGSGRQDFESETFIAFDCYNQAETGDVSHTLQSAGGRQNRMPVIAFDTTQITSATNRSNPCPGDPCPGDPCHPLAAGGHAPAIAFHNRQDPDVSGDVSHPIGAKDNGMAIAFQERGRADGRSLEIGGEVADALTASADGGRAQERNVLTPSMSVRRLTPLECERLQGFPDDHTLIPMRGKPATDTPRYKALGNSMAVPVIAWIGRSLQLNTIEASASQDSARQSAVRVNPGKEKNHE